MLTGSASGVAWGAPSAQVLNELLPPCCQAPPAAGLMAPLPFDVPNRMHTRNDWQARTASKLEPQGHTARLLCSPMRWLPSGARSPNMCDCAVHSRWTGGGGEGLLACPHRSLKEGVEWRRRGGHLPCRYVGDPTLAKGGKHGIPRAGWQMIWGFPPHAACSALPCPALF